MNEQLTKDQLRQKEQFAHLSALLMALDARSNERTPNTDPNIRTNVHRGSHVAPAVALGAASCWVILN